MIHPRILRLLNAGWWNDGKTVSQTARRLRGKMGTAEVRSQTERLVELGLLLDRTALPEPAAA